MRKGMKARQASVSDAEDARTPAGKKRRIGRSFSGIKYLFKKCKYIRRGAAGQGPMNPEDAQYAYGMPAGSGGPVPVTIIQEKKAEPAEDEKNSLANPSVRAVRLKSALSKRRHVLNAEDDKDDLRGRDITYPLTPSNPGRGEKVYAWCSIKFSADENAFAYSVIEPPLTEQDRKEIKRIKDIIEEKIDIKFDAIESGSSIAYLRNAIDGIIRQFGISLTPEQRLNYEYYILRDFVGLGKLQPLLNDPNIEDISCDGVGIPVFVYHRDSKLASLTTNIFFETRDELNDFVMKIAQRCGKAVSVADPMLEGALPDGSRVQAILETDIARRGSNITIRKFSKEPITPVHLMNYGSIDSYLLAYLWYLIEHRHSVLVSGSTASGKTSLLNALSLFIHPSMKIVSIEDTPELRLPHTHWVPEIAREGFGTGEHKIGEVSLFELLRGALRQRPDYIIVGEVRGQEAYILFQAMATGHAGLSTMHADTMEKVIDRLTTPPISLPASLIETLDVIVFIKRVRHHKSYIRRVAEVHEVVGCDLKTKQPKTRMVFRWNPESDTFDAILDSFVLGKLCTNEGIGEEEIRAELFARQKLLERLKTDEIAGYKDVGSILGDYYMNKEKVMDTLEQIELKEQGTQ